MINKIAWKTYFVFFCFNIAFIPCIYFFFPETNGHKLETLDAIFTQAHEKGENPVFTEKRYRKGKEDLDIAGAGDGDAAVKPEQEAATTNEKELSENEEKKEDL